MKQSYIIAFWSPFALPRLHFYTDFFTACLKAYGDIQCLNFRNYRDARTMRLLHQADLVIIGLAQDANLLNSYFCYPFEHFPNVRYALVDYFPRGAMDVKTLCRQYRISENQLARLPYNARFHEALCRGRSASYLKFANRNLSYDKAISFRRELDRSAKIFLRALEDLR